MGLYKLSENNSGGSFWLNKSDYDALLADGWTLDETEVESRTGGMFSDGFLDEKDVPWAWRSALTLEADSMQEAIEAFERVTGQNFFSQGCNCCGAPFSMTSQGDGEWEYMSGDSVNYVPVRPF